jgi:tRNA pseudouridine38-40 synthase
VPGASTGGPASIDERVDFPLSLPSFGFVNQTQPGSRQIRCTVEYDGASFSGSQLQPSVPTVQGTIEAALGRLFDSPVRISAAGRTDSGVHATAQEIGFDAPDRWTTGSLRDSLNAVLPAEVGIVSLRETDPAFHPRFSATGRRYEYFVGDLPAAVSPLRAGRIWQLGQPVSITSLRSASTALLGPGDFTALSRAGQPERGTRCTIERATWIRTPLGDLRFEIVADRFLHRMVRYVVAVLIDIARESRAAEELRTLLSGGAQATPPRPAPPEGLYLTGVRYGDGWNRKPGVPGLWPIAADRTQAVSRLD